MEIMTLFEITKDDAQFSAKHRIGRELTFNELKEVQRYLQIAFEDWGIILKEAVLKTTGERKLQEN